MNEITSDFLEVRRLSENAQLPFRAYNESAAYDLSANLLREGNRSSTVSLAPGTTRTIPTGLAMRPPPGHCILVCSRSGMAKEGVFVANAPGVVDPNYTGEIMVILYNGGLKPFYVRHGERIGQALIVPFLSAHIKEVGDFPKTERGDKGFGSSGR